LLGNLEGDFVRSDRNNFSAWGFVKAACQRYTINLTKIHLLLELFEHNSNLSGPASLWQRMTSEVL